MKQKPTSPCLRAWYSYVLTGILTLGLLAASNFTYAQNSVLTKKVTYKASNKPLLNAIKEVKTIVKVRFTYNEDQLKKQPPVTINVKAENLSQVLQLMLTGTNLKFIEEFGGILIYPDQETETTKGKLSYVVTGQVTDKDNNPIPGVNIQGMQSKVGTVTVGDGTFSLLLVIGEPVRFSSMGMQSQTLFPKNDSKFMKVEMETATTQIQEVLVNGYQKIEPRLATGAYFKLKAADIMEPGVTSIDKMLQGKVPGLLIVNNSGSVNAAPTMRLRGTSTFIGNAAPLWVVDGVIKYDPVQISTETLTGVIGGNYEMMGNAISGINPYDIEDINFLRDAAATSIYGVRAANGVIVVTTKRGKIGPAQISYSANASYTRRPSYSDYNLMNSAQRIELSKQMFEDGFPILQFNGAVVNDSYETAYQNFYQRKITETEFNNKVAELSARNTDWFKILFNDAVSTNHNLSINGGNSNTTYYASIGYAKDQGSAKFDRNEKFTLSGNISTKIGKNFDVSLNYGGYYTEKTGYFNTAVNPFNYAFNTSRVVDPNDYYFMKYYTITSKRTTALNFNMLNELANTSNEESGHSFFSNIQMQYRLGSKWRIEELVSATITGNNKLIYATDRSYYVANQRGWDYDTLVSDIDVKGSLLPAGGIGSTSFTNALVITTRTSINYSSSLRNERDAVYFTLGAETNSQSAKGVFQQQSGFFPDRGMLFYPSLTGGQRFGITRLDNEKVNNLGVYFSSGYNINNRYTLSAVVRSDASNRFGQYSNQKFLPNFSLGSSWNIKNEDWLKHNRLISELSMNVSYGTQGNVVTQVGPDIVASYTNSSEGTINLYNRSKVRLFSLPYPDLRWEKTNQFDAGLNLGILRNKIATSFHVYKKWGHDLLVQHPVAFENGVKSTYLNGGSMNNSGIDLSLRIAPIQTKDITLSLTTNYALNFNKVLDTTFRNNTANYLNGTAYSDGKAIDGFYSLPYGGLDNSGMPVLRYTSDKMLAPTDFLVYSGQKLPKFQGGFMLMFRYKNLALTGNFTYQLGNHVRLNPLFSNTNGGINDMPTNEVNVNSQLVNRWRKPGDELVTDVPGLKDYLAAPVMYLPILSTSNLQERVGLYTLYDYADTRVVRGDFLKCKNINATYSFNSKALQKYKLKGATLNLSVANPFYFASKRLQGQDPETNGLGSAALPITPSFTGGFNVTF